jgi:phage gpG-like protein
MADTPFPVTVDVSRAIAKIGRVSEKTRAALRPAMVSLAADLKASVLVKLSGAVLNKISGALYDSIKSQLIENTTSIYSRVYVDPASPAAKYAAIHEYGGVIHHPGSDKFQAWQAGGAWIYTNHTKPHDIPMPERSYMRSSLEEMRGQIIDRLTTAARAGAGAA